MSDSKQNDSMSFNLKEESVEPTSEKNIESMRNLLRGASKISSAIQDFYELEGETVMKGTLKKELTHFFDLFNKRTDHAMNVFYSLQPEISQGIVDTFDDYAKHVKFGDNENVSRVILLYCKLNSALRDLTLVFDNNDKYIAMPVMVSLYHLLKMKMWRVYISQGMKLGMTHVLRSMGEIGREQLNSSKQSNEE